MLKSVSVYAFGFAAAGVADSLLLSTGLGNGASVNLSLVMTLFILGVFGGLAVERHLIALRGGGRS